MPILYANEHCFGIVGWTPERADRQADRVADPRRLIEVHRREKGYTDGPNAPPMEAGLLLTALHRSGHEVPVEIALSPLSGEVASNGRDACATSPSDSRRPLLAEAETQLEVLDDRDRIARELHDSVIQRLFAAGLHLQASTDRPDTTERVSARRRRDR